MTTRIGRGRPVTVFAPGEFRTPEAGIDQVRQSAVDVKGTRVLLYYEHSGHFSTLPRLRRQADRDAAEVLAVADAVRASRAVGISRGARAVLGALAEEPARFERVVLMVPPGGNAVGFFRDWLGGLPIGGSPITGDVLVLGMRGDAAHPARVAEEWAERLGAELAIFDKRGDVPGAEQLRNAATAFLNR